MYGSPFGDILHPEFEVFRMGSMGWRIGVSEVERVRFGVDLEEISTMGSEKGGEEDGLIEDYFTGVELLRGVVLIAFVEQSKIEGKPEPVMRSKLIDYPPVKRALLDGVSSTKTGMFVMVTEDLDAQMQQENLRLYQEIMKLKDNLVDRFTPRTIQLYKGQPEPFLKHYTPVIKDRWEETLREMTLRTYGWLTPNQPNLVPVKVDPQS